MDPSDHDKRDLGNGPSGGHGPTHANGGPQEGEGWLRSALENSSEILKVLDFDGTLRYASPAFGRILGYDPEEAVGRMNVLDHVHPNDLPHVLEETERALAKGGATSSRTEYRFRHKDGSWRWMEGVGTYLPDDPTVRGVVVNARDVTERKEAEQALRENERRLSSVISNAHAYAYRCLNEPGWPNEYASDYALELTGYPSEDLLVGGDVKLGDLIVEEDRQRVWEEVQEALTEGRGFELRYALRRRDDQIRHVHEYGRGVYGEDGEVVALEGLLYDVTEHREAEGALRRAEERYRTLVEQIPAVTYIDWADGSFDGLYTSPQIEDLLGYTPEEWVEEKLWEKRLHPDDRERILAADDRLEVHGKAFVEEYRILAKDGSVVWVREEAVLVRDREGEPLFWQGVIFDLTERRNTEEALRRSEALLAESQRIARLGTWEWDVRTGEVWWSEETFRIHGLRPGEESDLRGRVEEAFFPEDLSLYRRKIEETLSGEADGYDYEHRIRKADGEVRWVRAQAEVVRGEAGESLRVVGTVHDVTERKEAEEALRRSEERYRTLVEKIPPIIYIQTPRKGEIAAYDTTYMSPRVEEVLGYPPQRFTKEPGFWDDLIHPEDLGAVREEDERTDETGEPFFMEYRVTAKDERTAWIRDEATLVRDGGGEPLYWLGVQTDVTERKEAEERYRTLVERVPVAIYRQEVEHDGAVTYISPQIEAITGYAPEEYEDPNFWIRTMHPDDRRRVLDEDERTDRTGEPFKVEFRKITRDGRVIWLRDEAALVRDEAGEPIYWQGVVQDVTERKTLEERLERQAFHDPLTGLPNRRLFVDRLGQALEGTRRQDRSVAVLFMDLNDFKVVNDSLGHEAGDLLLMVVAQRLRRSLRPGDMLARFGGDEFVVLIEDVEDPGEAVNVTVRITEELLRPFALEGRELYVSASIGICFGTARTKTPENLLRDADTAMYQAKEAGGGFRVFDQAMHERVARRLDLENDLRRAVEWGEFVLHYQPVFDLGDQLVWGTEALLRWDHPERGLLGPSEFVAIAEETGLIVPMGAWALEEACRQTKEWQDGHPRTPPLRVIVNLSGRQLRHPGCERTIRVALERSGLPPESLSLDVTETAFIDALEDNRAALERIRALGVRISIDDFGMGYSSLSYLKRLPADALKIDKSFLIGFGEDAKDTALVRMVIDMGHTLGMQVIAEGVEKWAQASLLAETGCDMAQGYHFSGPVPPEQVPGLLGV